jgi:hypothetical protein
MRDEVPVGVAGDLRAERALTQGPVAVHVKDPQARGVGEKLEHAPGVSARVMLEDDYRLVLSEDSQPSLQDIELCPLDIELDQRRHIVSRQSLVQSTDVDLELFDLLNVVSVDVKAAARVGRQDSGESPYTARTRQRGLSYVNLRERLAKLSGAIGKRLEGNVVPIWGIPNHVPQEIAGIGTDVDAVGIRWERQRKQETQCLIVAHRAPGLSRPDRSLDHAQLWLQPGTLGEPQHLAAGGRHNTERVIDIAIL